MKLAQPDVQFHSRGVQGSARYQVAQSSHVMDMFSNRLYSNKIKAVIRELSTNAWDAHIMADTTHLVPDMTLPTRKSPEFRLRDYGTGMSQSDLEEMYSRYGESNKNHSDLFNGCMGIGSKSPFAYAASFTTTSYFNGKKYVYVNAKDMDNMPTMRLMSVADTDEPNGLEISFAVDSDDISDFEEEAEEVMAWFPKCFKVYGTKTFSPKKYKYVLERSEWKIREYSYYDIGSYVIMGNVAYPIDQEHTAFQEEFDEGQDKTSWYQHYNRNQSNGRSRHYVDLLNSNLELHFDIGEVEMDASREGLQYTKRTVKAICDRLDKIIAEITSELQKEIDQCETYWEACVVSNSFSPFGSKTDRFVDFDAIKWKGKDIENRFAIVDIVNGKSKSKLSHCEVIAFSKDSWRKTPERQDFVKSIIATKRVKLFLADKKKGNYIAVSRFLKSQNEYSDTDPNKVYLVKDLDGKGIKEFCGLVGCKESDLLLCSDVPVPPREKRSGNGTSAEKAFVFESAGNADVGNSRFDKAYWTPSDVDFAQGGIFVEINNWKVKDGSLWRHPSELAATIKSFKRLGVTIPVIAGIKTSAVEKFHKSDKWQSAYDWMMEQAKSVSLTDAEAKEIAEINNFRDFGGRDRWTQMVKVLPRIQKTDGLFYKVLDKVKKVDKLNDVDNKLFAKARAIKHLQKHFGIKETGSKIYANIDWDAITDKVEKHYPFLHFVDRWDLRTDEDFNKFVETINLIDSCSKGNENE